MGSLSESRRRHSLAKLTVIVLVAMVSIASLVCLGVWGRRAAEARALTREALVGRIGDDWTSFSAEHGDLGEQKELGRTCHRLRNGLCAVVDEDVVVGVVWDLDGFGGMIEPGQDKDTTFHAMTAYLPKDAEQVESIYRTNPMDDSTGWHRYRYVSDALTLQHAAVDWQDSAPGTIEVVLDEMGDTIEPRSGPIGAAIIEYPPSGKY
jgi:hypothetical protein